MHTFDPTNEPTHLDISSEPNSTQLPRNSANAPQPDNRRQAKVKLFFGCCRVAALLSPPPHVIQGRADLWRAHCPRCGGIVEIRVE